MSRGGLPPRTTAASAGASQRAPLRASFFARPAELVAAELLGAIIVSTIGGRRAAGRIVETEAYLGYYDPASHGYRHRRTATNAALFGPPGSWYVYLSYGLHWCCNLVCERRGSGSAVLLRALEPLEGLEIMRARRGGDVSDRALCAGPGRLSEALGITRALDGSAMGRSEVRVFPGDVPAAAEVFAGPRIGITKAADWPLRYIVRHSAWHSRARRRG